MSLFPCLALAAPLLAQAPQLAQHPQLTQHPQLAQHQGGAAPSAVLRSIDGRPVDPLDVARFEIYLLDGPAIERKIDAMLADEERRSRIAAGAALADTTESPAAVRQREAAHRASLSRVETTLEKHLAKRGETLMEYRVRLRASMRVESAFLGGQPSTWTERTRRILRTSIICRPPLGARWQSEDERLRAALKDPRQREQCCEIVLRALRKTVAVRSVCDGLPPSEVLRVGPQVWKTRDAVRDARASRSREEQLEARTFFVAATVLRRELEASGHWGDDDAERAAFAKVRLRLPLTEFTEAERLVWRLERGFERKFAREIDAAALRAHAGRARGVLGRARVSADVVRFPILAGETSADASARAEAWLAKLESERLPWEQQVAKLCAAETARSLELRDALFSEAQHAIGETSVRNFVRGYSVARTLFGAREPGACYGPVQGTNEVYVVRKLRESDPEWREIDAATLRADYVRCRFLEWAAERLGRVRIR